MRTLDGTDREISRLLLADARRPYSDIAERVGLSGPAIADRVERLRETGVIEGFTLRVDDAALSGGTTTLVTLRVATADAARVDESVADHDRVEHAFPTADGDVTFSTIVEDTGVRGLVAEAVGLVSVRELSVRVVDQDDWSRRSATSTSLSTASSATVPSGLRGSRPGSTARSITSVVPPGETTSRTDTTGPPRGREFPPAESNLLEGGRVRRIRSPVV